MSDAYWNFDDLKAHQREGVDYVVRTRIRDPGIVIMAPHGGGIEPGTAPLAREIAGEDYTSYSFEGVKKGGGNRCLHITSTRFDEPTAEALAAAAEIVLTVHGARENDGDWVMVGGLDADLAQSVAEKLDVIGFTVRECDSRRAARDQTNICNRTARRRGVQLELSAGLRHRLKEDRLARRQFVSAIRSAIAERRRNGA